MKRLLMLAAAGEAAVGLALLVHPPVVVRLLFGAEIVGAGIAIATVYLAYLGIGGGGVGSLLWPAAAILAVLTVLLAKTWSGARRVPAGVNR